MTGENSSSRGPSSTAMLLDIPKQSKMKHSSFIPVFTSGTTAVLPSSLGVYQKKGGGNGGGEGKGEGGEIRTVKHMVNNGCQCSFSRGVETLVCSSAYYPYTTRRSYYITLLLKSTESKTTYNYMPPNLISHVKRKT